MKSRIYLTIVAVLCLSFFNVQAAFTSYFVFGDGLSCTASNTSGLASYYGKRFSNGRVWVEVLAQMQGLAFDPLKNTNSFFGNTSSNLTAQVAAFKPPTDAANALVVIWVNNADLYYPAFDATPTFAKFNSATTNALARQQAAVVTLYAKGIRSIVMPNVVDISTVPEFNTYTAKTNLLRQACTNYNAQFYAMINRVCAQCPGLDIVVPDYFSFLGDMLKSPGKYGVTNALYGKLSIDAISDPSLTDKSVAGPGASYIFWDSTDPSAKVHYLMASIAQQLLSPAQIGLAQLGENNRIDLINAPIGMPGVLENSTNLTSWIVVTNFIPVASSQSFLIPAPPLPADFGAGGGGTGGGGGIDPTNPNNWHSGTNAVKPIVTASQLYRLRFPYNWVWP